MISGYQLWVNNELISQQMRYEEQHVPAAFIGYSKHGGGYTTGIVYMRGPAGKETN